MKMSPALPSVEDHLETYRDMVSKMGPAPVIIRTFDLGGRKLAREIIGGRHRGQPGAGAAWDPSVFFPSRVLPHPTARDPSGGRVSSRLARVRILFPLISGIEEFRIARLLVREITAELEAKTAPRPQKRAARRDDRGPIRGRHGPRSRPGGRFHVDRHQRPDSVFACGRSFQQSGC